MAKQKETKEKKSTTQAIATAHLRFLHIAPRKVRLVTDLIKHMHVNEAQAQLVMSTKRSSVAVLKLLNSALANAKQKQMNQDALTIKEIRVDEGPMLKRFLPRAMGRATPIHKKMSHVTLILEEAKERAPRFVVATPKKKEEKKKGEKQSVQQHETPAEKTSEEEKHGHGHDHEHDHGEKTTPKAPKKGFGQKIFRRKSV